MAVTNFNEICVRFARAKYGNNEDAAYPLLAAEIRLYDPSSPLKIKRVTGPTSFRPVVGMFDSAKYSLGVRSHQRTFRFTADQIRNRTIRLVSSIVAIWKNDNLSIFNNFY